MDRQVTHQSGLPHLPGVPHLYVNRHVVVQGRQRNVQKKRDARAELLFCSLNLLLFDVDVAVAVVVS